MDETESTKNVNDVTILDHRFLNGDFVAATSDLTGQVGLGWFPYAFQKRLEMNKAFHYG
jgi:hypothetical protein